MNHASIGIGIQQFLVQVFPVTDQHGFCKPCVLFVFDLLLDDGQYLFLGLEHPTLSHFIRLNNLGVLIGAF